MLGEISKPNELAELSERDKQILAGEDYSEEQLGKNEINV
jgi:hypothetical protein